MYSGFFMYSAGNQTQDFCFLGKHCAIELQSQPLQSVFLLLPSNNEVPHPTITVLKIIPHTKNPENIKLNEMTSINRE